MLHPRPQSHLPDCLAKMKERRGGEALRRSNPFLFALAFCCTSFLFLPLVFSPFHLDVFFERRKEEKTAQCSKKSEKENMEKKWNRGILSIRYIHYFLAEEKVSNTGNDTRRMKKNLIFFVVYPFLLSLSKKGKGKKEGYIRIVFYPFESISNLFFSRRRCKS